MRTVARARLLLGLFAASSLMTSILAVPANADVPQGASIRIEGINTTPSMRGWLSSEAQVDSWYDNANGVALLNADVARLKDLGIRHLRLEVPWPLIERTQGNYTWTRLDTILATMRDAAITVQASISFTPQWAQVGGNTPESVRSTGGRTGYFWSQIPTGNTYPTFVTAVAQRFKASFPGVVDEIEIWNEPDLQYWAGSAADYSNVLLEPGYAAVKAVDASVKVVVGPSFANTAWLDGVKNAGGLNSFDVLSHHFYGDSTADLQNAYNTISGWMTTNGISARPLQLDEFGGASAANSALIRYSFTSPALGYSRVQMYNLRDDNDTYFDGSVSYYGHWGLIDHSGLTLKPEYVLLKSILTTGNGPVINDNTVGSGQNQFQYGGTWSYSSADSNAFFGDTHWTNTANSTYQLMFTGNSVRVLATKGSANGIMAVSLDGGAETLVDTYAPTRQDQALLFSSPTLNYGTHTLVVRVTSQKNASSNNFYIQADRVEVGSAFNDNTIGAANNQFSYTGTWNYSGTDSNAFQSDTHWTNVPGSRYQFVFSGTKIEVFATRGTANGIMAVSIDGGPETLADTFATIRQDQVLLFTSPTLTAGSHTLAVRVTGQKNAYATSSYVQADKVVVF